MLFLNVINVMNFEHKTTFNYVLVKKKRTPIKAFSL